MSEDREYYEDDDLDDLDEADLNCGSHTKGQCDLAGTEYCDWSCPFSDSVFSALSPSGEAVSAGKLDGEGARDEP